MTSEEPSAPEEESLESEEPVWAGRLSYMVVRGEEVLRWGSCEKDLEGRIPLGDGESLVEIAESPAEKWWDGEALQAKTPMPLNITGTVVEAPPGTKYILMDPIPMAGEAGEDGLLEFSFDEPGDYLVELTHPRHHDAEVTLHAD